MGKRTSFSSIVFIFAAFLVVIIFVHEYFKIPKELEKQEKIVVHKDYNFILLSQQELKDLLLCENIDLWTESKESYELVNDVTLNLTSFIMTFSKDPACIDPLGGESEWVYDKVCYQYQYPVGSDQIKEAKIVVEGKNIVFIGSAYLNNNPSKFVGKLCWY